MPGELQGVGFIAKLADTVLSWVLSEDGLADWRKTRMANRLQKKADAALMQWEQSKTVEDWKAYQHAKAELARFSDQP